MELPQESRVRWKSYHRIISSRFPPVFFFERVAPPEDWDDLAEIEAITNPRVRQDIGEISLVPVEKRVSGPGASYCMAPFVHISQERPSRFSNGAMYGVFYASQDFESALMEVAHHRAVHFAATDDEPLTTQERVLVGKIDSKLHDIRDKKWAKYHDPDGYSESQAFAQKLRDKGSEGIVYNSVRNPGGQNFAAFWPNVMDIPIQASHISYHWDGNRIDKYFDLTKDDGWIEI